MPRAWVELEDLDPRGGGAVQAARDERLGVRGHVDIPQPPRELREAAAERKPRDHRRRSEQRVATESRGREPIGGDAGALIGCGDRRARARGADDRVDLLRDRRIARSGGDRPRSRRAEVDLARVQTGPRQRRERPAGGSGLGAGLERRGDAGLW